jgi:hypothetical protein
MNEFEYLDTTAEETDAFRIYQAFLSQLNQLGQMCRLLSGDSEYCKFDSPATVANRITIGLGLFYEQAARRHQRQAAPPPQFYQQMAISCFAMTGYKTIALRHPVQKNRLDHQHIGFIPSAGATKPNDHPTKFTELSRDNNAGQGLSPPGRGN